MGPYDEYTTCDVCANDAAPGDHVCPEHREALDRIEETIRSHCYACRSIRALEVLFDEIEGDLPPSRPQDDGSDPGVPF